MIGNQIIRALDSETREFVLGRLARPQAQVVNIQEVADFQYQYDPRVVLRLRADLQRCLPPWPIFWAEWRKPELINIEGNIQPGANAGLPMAILAEVTEDHEDRPGDLQGIPKWELFCVCFWGMDHPFFGTISCLFDSDGIPLVCADGKEQFRAGLHPVWRERCAADLGSEEFGEEGECFLSGAWLRTVLLASKFCHCRAGVRWRAEEIPEKARRKTRYRGGTPIWKWHTLEIPRMQAVLARAIREHGSLAAGLHFCRSHFRTYSEERPGFGSFVGEMFIPSHFRGNPLRGEIRKDYRIVPQASGLMADG